MATLLNDRNELLFSASSRVTGASVSITPGAATSVIFPKNSTTPVPSAVTLTANLTGYLAPSFTWSYRFGNTGDFTAIAQTTNPVTVSWNNAFYTAAAASTIIQYKVVVVETTSNLGINQSEFILSVPIIREGSDGAPGINNVVVRLYKRTANNAAPTVDYSENSQSTYTFSTGQVIGQPTGWTQAIPTTTNLIPYLWMIEVTAASPNLSYSFANTLWTAPVLFTQNGIDGVPGTNTATVFVYKRATNLPTDNPGTVDYSFSTNAITTATLANNWSKTIPTGTDTIYITAATASSTATTDTIQSTEWSTPVKFVENATNSATVFLYARNSNSSTAPTLVTAESATYNFTNGVLSGTIPAGWTQALPDIANGTVLWAVQAIAINTSTVDTIANTEWSTARVLSVNGTNGSPGASGISVYVATVYKQSAEALTAPAADTSSYNFATNTLTPPTGWSSTQPATTTTPTYACDYTFSGAPGATITGTGSWSTPYVEAVNGINGNPGAPGEYRDTIQLYLTSAIVPTKPTSIPYNFNSNTVGTQTGGTAGWSLTRPAATTTPTYVTSALAATTTPAVDVALTTWSNPVIAAQVGTDGAPGTRGTRQLYVNDVKYNSTYKFNESPTPTAGAQSYAVAATTLIAAATAGSVPTTPIKGDTVTFTNGSTYVYTITYNSDTTTWEAPGTVIDGTLLVTGSVTAAKINSRGLSIRNAAGTVILSAGVDPDAVGLSDSSFNIPPTVTNVPGGWLNQNITVDANGILVGTGTPSVKVDNTKITVDANGILVGTGTVDVKVNNAKITVNATTGILEGVGTDNVKVNNEKIIVDANGILVGTGTADVKVNNAKITVNADGTLTGAGTGQVTSTGLGINTYRIVAMGNNTTPAPTGLAPAATGVYKNGTIAQSSGRSYNLGKISRSNGDFTFVGTYDVFGAEAQAANLAAALNALDSSWIVVVWSHDEPLGNRLTNGLPAAMYRCGASPVIFASTNFKYRSAYVLVGIPGIGQGNGAEAYNGSVENATDAWVDMGFSIIKGQISGITGTNTPSRITDYGYTGDLDATKGAVAGTNLKDSAGTILTDTVIKNTSITVDANGVLVGTGTADVKVDNTKITVDANGVLVGTGTDNVKVNNEKITVDTNGVLVGTGTDNVKVNNEKITVDANGILVGTGTADVKVDNTKITVDANGVLVGTGATDVKVDNTKITVDSGSGTLQGIGTQGVVVDNTQVIVGGVNLVPGTATSTGWSGYTTFDSATNTFTKVNDGLVGEQYIYSPYITLPAGTTITLSFEAYNDVNVSSVEVYILPDNFASLSLLNWNYGKRSTWAKVSKVFITPSEWGTGTAVRLRFDHNGPTSGTSNIYIRNIKLEYGNKATAWSPANDEIKNSDITIDNTGTLQGVGTTGVKVDNSILVPSINGAATTATWSGVTGTGRPEDYANSTYLDGSGNIQGVSSGVGTSVSNNVDSIIRAPGGALFTTQTASITGAIKIRLPQFFTSSMIRMTVEVYQYSTGRMFTCELGGYNNQGDVSWYSTSAKILGAPSDNFPVRFGHDGTKSCIWIGNHTSTWTYPQVRVRDVFVGYNNTNASFWSSGWTISFDPVQKTAGNGANQYTSEITNTAINAANINALATNAASILGATVSVDAIAGAGFRAGTLTWNAQGVRTAGAGVAMTPGGLVGHNGTKATFAIDATTGNATFGGSLDAATGTFSGTLSATAIFAGTLSAATGTFAGTLTAQAINAVNTINIGANAVTVPEHSYTEGGVTAPTDASWIDLQTVTVNVPGTGNSVSLVGVASSLSVYGGGTNFAPGQLRILDPAGGVVAVGGAFAVVCGKGTTTGIYKLQGKQLFSGTGTQEVRFFNRSLLAIGSKR
jgi:hypothetical protein